MNLFALVAVVAISIFALAEVLVAYKKYQLRKQFVEEMREDDEFGEKSA